MKRPCLKSTLLRGGLAVASLSLFSTVLSASSIENGAEAKRLQEQTNNALEKVRKETDIQALDTLAEKFQSSYEADEAAIVQYLEDNPDAKRLFEKDGRTYRLYRIDAEGTPRYRVTRNVESGKLIKADCLYPNSVAGACASVGGGVTGQNMIVGIWEIGTPRPTHELLDGQFTLQSGQTAANDDHASHVTGTVVGKALNSSAEAASARGLAFGAKAHNWDESNDLAEMAAAAGATPPLLVSNHSYGPANDFRQPPWEFGAYDGTSNSWDQLLKNAPFFLPFIAVGNEQQGSGSDKTDGYDVITGLASAKNVMTVGAVNADKTMSDYSNFGPTDDLRVKPELVARGTGVNSAQNANDTAYSGNDPMISSGTSYASPAAAAAAILLQQYYNNLHGSFMRAATLKSLMMSTAEDLGRPGPDYQFGYGLIDDEKAGNTIKNNSLVTGAGKVRMVTAANSRGGLIFEWPDNPAADSATEMTLDVVAKGNGTPLVVNLGWTDDAGPEQTVLEGVDPATSRMVYDFDVSLRKDAVDTWGWVVPSMANRTQNATRANGWFESNGGPFRQVIIAAPVADAVYKIVVRKKTGSPAAARNLAVVATGLKERSGETLSISGGGDVPEGNGGTTNMTFTVTLSTASVGVTTVNYSVTGTATAGTDFTSPGTSVAIQNGDTTATITVPVTGDTEVESNETVIVTLTSADNNAVLLPSKSATGTIVNDDTPPDNTSPTGETLSISGGGDVPEGNGGTTNMTFTVTLSTASVGVTTVNYSVTGTATAGTDFTSPGSSVAIQNGETTATITVPLTGDTEIEPNETVIVTLTSADNNSTVGTPDSSTGTIVNDDGLRNTSGSNIISKSSGGGCVIGEGGRFDPLLLLLMLVSMVVISRRKAV